MAWNLLPHPPLQPALRIYSLCILWSRAEWGNQVSHSRFSPGSATCSLTSLSLSFLSYHRKRTLSLKTIMKMNNLWERPTPWQRSLSFGFWWLTSVRPPGGRPSVLREQGMWSCSDGSRSEGQGSGHREQGGVQQGPAYKCVLSRWVLKVSWCPAGGPGSMCGHPCPFIRRQATPRVHYPWPRYRAVTRPASYVSVFIPVRMTYKRKEVKAGDNLLRPR